jgi:Primase C terminal 1 (PriCT-1)
MNRRKKMTKTKAASEILSEDQINQFAALFEGSVRSHGVWKPDTGKMFTQKTAPSFTDFQNHLTGRVGIGVVPVLRDRFSKWGAIDIDLNDIDHIALEKLVRSNGLPLTVCRSKSGGAHLYLFLKEAIAASAIRTVLGSWARRLGYGASEVFPKQNEVSSEVLGNWINLPYFNSSESNRYAVEGGKVAPFHYFLESAMGRATNNIDIQGADAALHAEAPPCIQTMLAKGIQPGTRNEALYNITVYLRRAFPDDYVERALAINARSKDPLPIQEAKTTIKSAGRKEYQYKCSQEPCKSLCDSATCVTRKFGITPSEIPVTNEELGFTKLARLNSEPVVWELTVDGKVVRVQTPMLMKFEKIREAVAEAHARIIPAMKNKDWEALLGELMTKVVHVDTPDEASVSGVVRSRLREFVSKVVGMNGNGQDRENLLRGMPVMEVRDDKKVVYFQGASFVDFLKKTRSEELKGINLWLALKKSGVTHTRFRVRGEVVNVWYVDINEQGEPDFNVPKFEPEF